MLTPIPTLLRAIGQKYGHNFARISKEVLPHRTRAQVWQGWCCSVSVFVSLFLSLAPGLWVARGVSLAGGEACAAPVCERQYGGSPNAAPEDRTMGRRRGRAVGVGGRLLHASTVLRSILVDVGGSHPPCICTQYAAWGSTALASKHITGRATSLVRDR